MSRARLDPHALLLGATNPAAMLAGLVRHRHRTVWALAAAAATAVAAVCAMLLVLAVTVSPVMVTVGIAGSVLSKVADLFGTARAATVSQEPSCAPPVTERP